jgi:hypothetical protein
VEWTAGFLPDSVEEHLDFEPEIEKDEKKSDKDKDLEEA